MHSTVTPILSFHSFFVSASYTLFSSQSTLGCLALSSLTVPLSLPLSLYLPNSDTLTDSATPRPAPQSNTTTHHIFQCHISPKVTLF
ncbi:hypothetical protein E2C01_046664 [Portunus trituberculatus]|uniref:Uncharacterized protein n=1 Tax=Portunus trituberculatus TaxID=210409 RepID=A0A5B7G5R2_PORTR|nr:hypothetical protein [Portunus trituberculatus]